MDDNIDTDKISLKCSLFYELSTVLMQFAVKPLAIYGTQKLASRYNNGLCVFIGIYVVCLICTFNLFKACINQLSSFNWGRRKKKKKMKWKTQIGYYLHFQLEGHILPTKVSPFQTKGIKIHSPYFNKMLGSLDPSGPLKDY